MTPPVWARSYKLMRVAVTVAYALSKQKASVWQGGSGGRGGHKKACMAQELEDALGGD